MTQAHLHLVITHLPIFGSIIGALVLGFGIWTKSIQTQKAAYLVFVLSAIGAGMAYLTGESAEETVENVLGVSENIIKQHEAFAMYALVSCIVLGVSSLIALFVTFKKTAFSKTAATITILISLISFSLVAWTGYLGGQIRHTEITNGPVQNNAAGEKEGKDDD